MAPPKERKRRFHRRSKNGCKTCKRRHVRCDERQPLCVAPKFDCHARSRQRKLTKSANSTNCLQSGAECEYPDPDDASSSADNRPSGADSPSAGALVTTADMNPEADSLLNNYVGGSFEALPEASKRLLRHFSQYAVSGQRPVLREIESATIHRAFEHPGHMHMCLMLSACQWAWVTGSMEEVRIPFLYHKAATYQFAREQLQNPQTTQSGDAMLAISSLALAEGAIGELETSSRHLRAVRWTSPQTEQARTEMSLPQRMLKLIGDGLRNGRPGRLLNVPDYQPTLMALLFASIWDVTALPPREAPRYGWWEESDTAAARLWQNHTRELNLNYEISRDFEPNQFVPRILNGDPRSSRTSFIATFFYLCTELAHDHLDAVLIDWLLEQLVEDVRVDMDALMGSAWSYSLWLWCVLFGSAVLQLGRPSNPVEERLLQEWTKTYDDMIILSCQTRGSMDWESARQVLGGVIVNIDQETDQALGDLWNQAILRVHMREQYGIDPAAVLDLSHEGDIYGL